MRRVVFVVHDLGTHPLQGGATRVVRSEVHDAIAALDIVARTPMGNVAGVIVEGRHELFGNTENTSIPGLQCAQDSTVDEEKRGRRGISPP